MGTLIRITLHAQDEARANAAIAAAKARFEGLDASLSDYKPDSELIKPAGTPQGKRQIHLTELPPVFHAHTCQTHRDRLLVRAVVK